MNLRPNRLIRESSPYLLQHAGNPVDWYPWCDEAFETAKRDGKLVLVSIGYSACHWCHVMEHESFEDAATARIMNENFVCIKVDREERPDVDQVYMAAVQLLTGQGGWPLNCFALPDGRPVYGGTYFPRTRWQDVLLNLSDLYRYNKQKVLDYAEQITQGVDQQELIPSGQTDSSDPLEHIKSSVERWKSRFDMTEGGSGSAPKFPLPDNLMFLMMFEHLFPDQIIEFYVKLTLKKMALGGIYDHLGGGFARYSVDPYWKVPHFEKMLYDNAQLISLYSQAYRKYHDPLYLQVVNETIDFLVRDLSGGNGNFFSALDADSEGVEGKYYVWTEDELRRYLGEDADVFCSYYSVGGKGLWEHEQNILLRDSDSQMVLPEGMDQIALQQRIDECKRRLLKVRYTRIPPGLDDKTLASWNGLMITALCDAYDASGNEDYLNLALKSARFIRQHMLGTDGRLWHSWKAEPSVNGFLEDYAFTIQGFIRLYQCTFNREWLDLSRDLSLYALDHFSDSRSPFLFFNSSADPGLFIRKHEIHDNVIPSSNSQMAFNLHFLGRYFENEYFKGKSKQMWNAVAPGVVSYGSAWSNWMALGLMLATKPHELVFCGKEALKERSAVAARYFPLVMTAGAETDDGLPLTAHRVPSEGTLVYECIDHTCALPAASAEAFLGAHDRKGVL